VDTADLKTKWGAIVAVALAAVLCGLPVVGQLPPGAVVSAQGEAAWEAPVNLSHSGTAAQPAVVQGPGGPQVFWWDRFDGLLTTRWDVDEWRAPLSSPIMVERTARDGTELAPVGQMPRITDDGKGWAHAWWLGAADPGTGAMPLLHSALEVGHSQWRVAALVAESAVAYEVIADPAGELHLAYVRAQHSEGQPAGVYYTRSTDRGETWSAPLALYESFYFRALTAEQAHVRLAADGEGHIYAVWDEPRLERSWLAVSTDGGETWSEPQATPDRNWQARSLWVAARPGQVILIWEDARVAACTLYQVVSGDVGETWSERQRVLEGFRACAQGLELASSGDQALLIGGRGTAALTLAGWDGQRWSEPKQVSLRFTDPELDRQRSLEALDVALGDAPLLVGTAAGGDIWAARGPAGVLQLVWAEPPAWSAPISLSEEGAWPGTPAMAADSEGRIHLLWSRATSAAGVTVALDYLRWDPAAGEGTLASRPAEIWSASDGQASTPALAAVGDMLHAVWSGGRDGEILYSRAEAREAYGSGGWSEPLVLPAPSAVGASPAIVADAYGVLHVVYAVPLNERRGIYYTRSADGGVSWSDAAAVFDAEAAGWAMAAHPALAVDAQGVVHVAWTQAALPGPLSPLGVYYARSTDQGSTWTEALQVVEGAYDWPRLAATGTGQVHLLWSAAGSGEAWQQWSTDGGQGWSRPAQVRGWRNVPGPLSPAGDGAGALHLAGIGQDDVGEPALLYAAWDGGQWSAVETYRLEVGGQVPAGLGLLVQSAQGRVSVAFRAATATGQRVWVTQCAVPQVEVAPAPTLTPLPTPTVLPSPSPSPTLRGDLPVGQTLSTGGMTEIPAAVPIAGLLAGGIVAAVVAARLWWGKKR